jgi:hypothetical protein
MKKVAATSGQSVSLATLFFAVEMELEGSWAGRDKELNFYSRPPNDLRSRRCGEANSHSQNTRVTPACKKKMHLSKNIFGAPVHAFAPSERRSQRLLRPAPDFPLRAVYPQGL